MVEIICVLLSIALFYVSGNYIFLMYNTKKKISEFVDEFVDEVYPCKMFATIRYGQENNQTIVDMSRYEKLGVIGVTIDKTDQPANPKEEAIDNETIFYSPAVVYKVGGHWLWKVL